MNSGKLFRVLSTNSNKDRNLTTLTQALYGKEQRPSKSILIKKVELEIISEVHRLFISKIWSKLTEDSKTNIKDYDIDAVSIETFDIDQNGQLLLWSPYADISSVEMMNESMQLPFPTGERLTIPQYEGDNTVDILNFTIQELSNLVNRGHLFRVELQRNRKGEVDKNKVNVELTIDSPTQLIMLKHLLDIAPTLRKPQDAQVLSVMKALQARGVFPAPLTINQTNDFFNQIENIINDHNLYFDELSEKQIVRSINNYLMNSIYNISSDPVNLIESQAPMDEITSPLKAVADSSASAKDAMQNTPFNPFNKMESIVDNQTGKDVIGISAVGLKVFFGLSLYCNMILNNPNAKQERLILGGKGITVGGKTYYTLGNIKPVSPKTIKARKLLRELAKCKNDVDFALILSAFLSLATDNAKELSLSKLNASQSMASLYLYGISIGMEFEDIANILMSDVGNIIRSMTSSNVFTKQVGFDRLTDTLFNYFDKLPTLIFEKYNTTRDPKGNKIDSASKIFMQKFTRAHPEMEGAVEPYIKGIGRSLNTRLIDKIMAIEKLRDTSGKHDFATENYNRLIDDLKRYIYQCHVISENESEYADIKTLAEGSQEFFTIGRIFSLNQGIKTKLDEFFKLKKHLTESLVNPSKKSFEKLDLLRFAFDAGARENYVEKYDRLKTSLNVLDAASTLPHIFGYVQALATADSELNSSYKYRSIEGLYAEAVEIVGKSPRYTDSIIRGILNFIGHNIIKYWMLNNDILVIIPKGNIAYNVFGHQYTLTEDTAFRLGTDYGNASFRSWFENEIIPNLKKGLIGGSKPIDYISGNLVILLLDFQRFNKTTTKNPTLLLALQGINMLPRTTSEKNLLDRYKAAFNNIGNTAYSYTTTDSTGSSVNNNQILIKDLFTYYAMIATDWKLSEISLMPLLDAYQDSGLLKNFHDFESLLDKSGLVETDTYKLEEYVAPVESPYVGKASVIRYRDLDGKYILWRKMTDLDYGNMDESLDDESLGIINDYSPTSYFTDTTIFTSGDPDMNQSYQYLLDNHRVRVSEDGKSAHVDKDTISLNPDFAYKIVDGKRVLNKDAINAQILSKLKENQC